MNILRKLVIGLLALILPLSLLGLAWSHVILSTLGNRDAIGGWLKDSGAYDKTIDAVLDSVGRGEGEGIGLPVDNPEIRNIATQAFNSDYLKNNAEGFLDGIYDFLEGKTATPMFEIDVAGAKTQLASGLSNYVLSRAQGLPRCAPNQAPEELDVYSATCLPPGFTPEQVGQAASDEVLKSEGFLPKASYSAEDITVTDKNGQKVSLADSEQLGHIKRAYSLSRVLPFVLVVLSALLAAGIVLLSSERRQGFKRVGKILITTAVPLVFSFLLLDRGSVWLRDRLANQDKKDAGAILEIAGDVLKTAAQDASRLLLVYAIVFAVVGVGILLACRFVKSSGAKPAEYDKAENQEPKIEADSGKTIDTRPAESQSNESAQKENKTT